VLDSIPLHGAVAKMDSLTLIRSAIRGLRKVAGRDLPAGLRAVLIHDEEYCAAGKPLCD